MQDPSFVRRGAALASVLFLLGIGGAPVAAQKPAPSGVTELIDFLVVADDGTPVTDLTAEDVTLKVDGKVRTLTSLQYIELASPLPVDRGTTLSAPLPSPYGSNRLDDSGRIVVIAIDRDSIRPGRERPAREAAMRFLSGLTSRDRVALVTLPRVEVELTTDHEQVRDALTRMTGQGTQERTASDAACRGRLILNTLTGMLQSLAAIDGPKTIVFISTGISPPTRDAPITGPPGQCEVRSVYFDEVAAAASQARAHFYVIQPNDEAVDSAANSIADPTASRFKSADDDLAGLQNLAGVTGGEIYRLNAVEAERVFARLSHESSAYYVAAFQPEMPERNGLPHAVQIKVARDNVTIRARPQFTIAKGDPKGGALTPQKMLREARQYRDLPLRATAYSSAVTGDTRLKVIAAAEPMDPSVTLKSAAVGIFDAKGKLAAQWTADKEELAGRPIVAALIAPAGQYRMRVAAVDSNGKYGTVDYNFRAGLESAGSALKLSAIALGVVRGNAGFRPRLQFGNESAAVSFFEIYGMPASSAEITVRMEVAESEDSPALVGTLANLQPTQDEDRRIAIAALALASLPPGDYLVRAIVNVNGRPAGKVYRTLRKIRM